VGRGDGEGEDWPTPLNAEVRKNEVANTSYPWLIEG